MKVYSHKLGEKFGLYKRQAGVDSPLLDTLDELVAQLEQL